MSEIIDAAVRAGANQVQRLAFTIADDEAAQREALRNAVVKARGDAQAIAAALGVKLGAIQSVVEQELGGARPLARQAFAAASDSAPATPIEPGQVEIRARVVLRTEMVPVISLDVRRSSQRIQISRHVVRVTLGDAEIGHRRARIHFLRRPEPAQHVLGRVGQHAGNVLPRRDALERRPHRHWGPTMPGTRWHVVQAGPARSPFSRALHRQCRAVHPRSERPRG